MRVLVKPKGTIVIEGEVVVGDPDGNEIIPPPTQRPGLVEVCGCGRSRARPFCDGSHKLDEGLGRLNTSGLVFGLLEVFGRRSERGCDTAV